MVKMGAIQRAVKVVAPPLESQLTEDMWQEGRGHHGKMIGPCLGTSDACPVT